MSESGVLRRISIVGSPGSGKSTFGAALAGALGVSFVELDALYWGREWTPAPREELFRLLEPHFERNSWVIDGNYTSFAQAEVWRRADTVIWLDLPRRTVVRAVVVRSVKRIVLRKRLWNGNRERLRKLLSRDPQQNMILFMWNQFDVYVDRYTAAMEDPAWSHIRFVRLTSRREMAVYLKGL